MLKNTAFSPNYNCTIHLRTDGVSERPISTAAGVRTHHCSADHISSESFEHDAPLVPAAFIYCKFQDRKLQACAIRGEERRGHASRLTVSTITHLSVCSEAPVSQVEKRLDETRQGHVKSIFFISIVRQAAIVGFCLATRLFFP